MVMAPRTVLPITSSPPVLCWTVSDPAMVLGAQLSSPGSPIRTKPVAPLTLTEPWEKVVPQIRTAAAPFALSEPVIVEFSMTTPAPL